MQLLAGVGDPFAGGRQLRVLGGGLLRQRLLQRRAQLPDAQVVGVGAEVERARGKRVEGYPALEQSVVVGAVIFGAYCKEMKRLVTQQGHA